MYTLLTQDSRVEGGLRPKRTLKGTVTHFTYSLHVVLIYILLFIHTTYTTILITDIYTHAYIAPFTSEDPKVPDHPGHYRRVTLQVWIKLIDLYGVDGPAIGKPVAGVCVYVLTCVFVTLFIYFIYLFSITCQSYMINIKQVYTYL